MRFAMRTASRIGERRGQSEKRVHDEHRLQRGFHADAELRHEQVGRARQQRACGRDQRADEAVAREYRGALDVFGRPRNHRVLERKKNADPAARRIERADERDRQQRPEIADRREAHAGRTHQQRRRDEQGSIVITVRAKTDHERHDTRPEQRGGGDDADFERAETEREQIDREQQAHVAVGKGPQASAQQQSPHDESTVRARRRRPRGRGIAAIGTVRVRQSTLLMDGVTAHLGAD
ncbi:MAG: hypothetical protein JWM26_4614 [Betaproteobacteria bacterium]|nr:hypothetical protein [Betaproteobacteria bacterium]